MGMNQKHIRTRRGCSSDPYDCDAGFSNWNLGRKGHFFEATAKQQHIPLISAFRKMNIYEHIWTYVNIYENMWTFALNLSANWRIPHSGCLFLTTWITSEISGDPNCLSSLMKYHGFANGCPILLISYPGFIMFYHVLSHFWSHFWSTFHPQVPWINPWPTGISLPALMDLSWIYHDCTKVYSFDCNSLMSGVLLILSNIMWHHVTPLFSWCIVPSK